MIKFQRWNPVLWWLEVHINFVQHFSRNFSRNIDNRFSIIARTYFEVYCFFKYTPPTDIVPHLNTSLMLHSVMHATLHEHVHPCKAHYNNWHSLIELMMVLVLESAINQPVSHNTEASLLLMYSRRCHWSKAHFYTCRYTAKYTWAYK